MTATTTKRTRSKAAQANSEVQPPEEYVIKDKPKSQTLPAGLYPEGTRLYTFKAKSTGETIHFPMEFEQPNAVWIWALYDKPFHVQTWEWMKQAKIPRIMQRKAVEIMDADPSEYMDLFNGWLEAVGGTSPGE